MMIMMIMPIRRRRSTSLWFFVEVTSTHFCSVYLQVKRSWFCFAFQRHRHKYLSQNLANYT